MEWDQSNVCRLLLLIILQLLQVQISVLIQNLILSHSIKKKNKRDQRKIKIKEYHNNNQQSLFSSLLSLTKCHHNKLTSQIQLNQIFVNELNTTNGTSIVFFYCVHTLQAKHVTAFNNSNGLYRIRKCFRTNSTFEHTITRFTTRCFVWSKI